MLQNPNRSPVHRLPVELVATIFLCALPGPDDLNAVDPRRSQTLLRSICRHWRAVTEITAAFWSTIFIQLSPISDANVAIEMLENAEGWSANQALSLYAVQRPNGYSSMPDSVSVSRKLNSVLLRLLPRTKLLHLDADASQTGLNDLFPIHNALQLRWLILELRTCISLKEVALFGNSDGVISLDVLSYNAVFFPDNFAFLRRASPRKLFVNVYWIEEEPMKAIGTLPRLQYLHLTGAMEIGLSGSLSSSTITSLDMEFRHYDREAVQEEINTLGSLPNLAHLVIRLAENSRSSSNRRLPIFQDLPQLPSLKTVTIGMGPRVLGGRWYSFCDCLVPLIFRAPSLIALEVHHGHALGVLQHLDGTEKKPGSNDTPCPNLELLRVIFTDHNARDRVEISQSCVKLPKDRPSLAIEWQEHRTLKFARREGEGDEIDSDDEELSWRKVPDEVKHNIRSFGGGLDGSLDSLYSSKPL